MRVNVELASEGAVVRDLPPRSRKGFWDSRGVCISGLIQISRCLHSHKYSHTHTYIHTHIHTYIFTFIHTYIHTYTHIHTYINTHTHTRTIFSKSKTAATKAAIHLTHTTKLAVAVVVT